MQIGIDLGRSYLRAALAENGRIIKKFKKPTEKSSSKALLKQLTSIIQDFGPAESIAIAAVGKIKPLEKMVCGLADLPRIELQKLEKKFEVPINLVNDCIAGVLAESKVGAGKNLTNIAYVTISSGIGAGIIVDGNLIWGKNRGAAEVGHFPIKAHAKLACSCGKRGHWEAFCSGESIPQFIKELASQNPKKAEKSLLSNKSDRFRKLSAKLLFGCAKKGDEFSLKIVEEIGKLNAAGFATIINAYDPELITVGGAVALHNSKLILKPLRKYLNEYAFNEIPEIKISPLGEEIVLKGTSLIASKPSLISKI